MLILVTTDVLAGWGREQSSNQEQVHTSWEHGGDKGKQGYLWYGCLKAGRSRTALLLFTLSSIPRNAYGIPLIVTSELVELLGKAQQSCHLPRTVHSRHCTILWHK